MILKCGCKILNADGTEPEPPNPNEEVVQRQKISFCKKHHDNLLELIKENGGVVTPEGQTLIPAGELSIKVLNIIEDYIQNLIFEGMRIKRPEENN